jgi:anti-sigma-K factor RskA
MQELVAVHALNALEADEAEAVERHLAECPRCRAELQEHRETAAMLAHVGAEAPSGLWERIAANLEEEPPDLARVFPLSAQRQKQPTISRWRRVVFAAAAVAAALIAVDTAVILRDHNENNSVATLAAKAFADPHSKLVSLRSPDGRHSIDAVLTEDGRGYVLHGKLAELDDDHTYQLWGIVDGKALISLGVLGREPKAAAFAADTPLNLLAITVEKAGGVIRSQNPPFVSGAVAS